PEEDLEEDDEEDPADYPADRGDDDDDTEEEEHLAPADPPAIAYSAATHFGGVTDWCYRLVTDPTTTTSVTSAQLQAMIDEGVTAVLAARATTRNGNDSHTSGTGARRNERTVRECTYQDFMKC
ncbi:hypothetical protein Tco_0402763, partial [Tanacetum coccineum]